MSSSRAARSPRTERQPAQLAEDTRTTSHDLPLPTSSPLLDLVMRQSDASGEIPAIVIGTICAFDASGMPLVSFSSAASSRPIPARALLPIDGASIGRSAALLFEGGRVDHPIIVGLVHSPGISLAATARSTRDLEADGQRLLVTAEREIVLRCGKSSITLTRAGKVIIRGDHLVSRSTGVNRIKGGSVQIN